MKETWLQIQELLEKSVPPTIFKVWLKPLKASVQDGRLVLLAPNDFVATWVRDRLQSDIAHAAEQVLGTVPQIRINSDPALTKTRMPLSRDGAESAQIGLPLDVVSPQKPGITMDWRYAFQDFVVGPCNELAYVAAKSVCSDSISMPEQLFISSQPGLGKTHLLQAVGNQLCRESNRKQVRIAYLSAEDFGRQYVMALKSHELERFKDRFRNNIDLLLLEDIQFFQGKEKMQDELLATLKALHNNQARIVFSSSYLPRELKALDSQLCSRFCSGLLTVIDLPCQETRRRILRSKARSFQVLVPDQVVDFLADRIQSDIRQLESCLKNLIHKARILNRAIDMEMAWEIIDHYATITPTLDMDAIVDFICDCYDLTPEQLASKSRKRQIVLARDVAFILARRHTELSLHDIGRRFNRRHSTVIKGIDKLERQIHLDTPLGRQVAQTIEMASRQPH